MTHGKSIKIKNRLRELMQQPGGRSVVEALRGADTRMVRIKDQCLAGLDRSIARLVTAAAALTDPPAPDLIADIYKTSNDVIAIARLVEFESLDEVAHGLCELIDHFRAESIGSALAIRVHVDAMQVLRGLTKDDVAELERILGGLRQVWLRFGILSSGAAA